MQAARYCIRGMAVKLLTYPYKLIPTPLHPQGDEIAQMVERRTVEPEAAGSNPAARNFFHAMLQQVTSDRV